MRGHADITVVAYCSRLPTFFPRTFSDSGWYLVRALSRPTMPYLFKLTATESPLFTTPPSVDAALASSAATLLEMLTSPRPMLLRLTPASSILLLETLSIPDKPLGDSFASSH